MNLTEGILQNAPATQLTISLAKSLGIEEALHQSKSKSFFRNWPSGGCVLVYFSRVLPF